MQPVDCILSQQIIHESLHMKHEYSADDKSMTNINKPQIYPKFFVFNFDFWHFESLNRFWQFIFILLRCECNRCLFNISVKVWINLIMIIIMQLSCLGVYLLVCRGLTKHADSLMDVSRSAHRDESDACVGNVSLFAMSCCLVQEPRGRISQCQKSNFSSFFSQANKECNAFRWNHYIRQWSL